jgi:hypothetical protein
VLTSQRTFLRTRRCAVGRAEADPHDLADRGK